MIQVTREKISRKVVDSLANASNSEEQFRAWRLQYGQTPRLIFHEAYHFWQGLRLPFLYWHAGKAFRQIFIAFRDFNRVAPDFHNWEGFLPEFHILSVRGRCWHIRGDRFALGDRNTPSPEHFQSQVDLSTIDLLEGATSLVEWQIDDGAKHESLARLVNPEVFSLWCKRHPAYITAFRFVARVLKSEKLAIRCFVPMVCAAFETTHPFGLSR